MKKILISSALVLACTAAPVHAGLKLPGLGQSSDSTQAADAPSGDALVVSFVTSQALVMNAQATLGAALGLKDQVLELQAQQKRLSSGQNDFDAIKKSRELSEKTNAEIAELLAKEHQLTDEQRAEFLKGLVAYAEALVGARRLMVDAQQFTASVGANPMAMMGKAKVALWVGKEVPGYAKGLGTSSRQLFDFARRNNIKPPANATAALDAFKS